MSKPAPFEQKNCEVKNKILLLEGKDDCHVVMQLSGKHNINIHRSFAMWDCNGYTNLLRLIDANVTQLNGNGKNGVLGIIVDNDQSDTAKLGMQSQLQAIEDKLRVVCDKYQISSNNLEKGLIIPSVDHYPKVGIWFMPNNQDQGMIEDFFMCLVDNQQIPGLSFAEHCVDGALNNGYADFKPVHRTKAIVHTYLAWQDKPGETLGIAIKTGKVNAHAPLAQDFIDWLKCLFEIS